MGDTLRDARWLAKSAERLGRKVNQTAVEYLETIQDAIVSGDLSVGKVLTTTSEAGGSATFSILPGHSPREMAQLCQTAIDILNGERKVRRFVANFRPSNPS